MGNISGQSANLEINKMSNKAVYRIAELVYKSGIRDPQLAMKDFELIFCSDNDYSHPVLFKLLVAYKNMFAQCFKILCDTNGAPCQQIIDSLN